MLKYLFAFAALVSSAPVIAIAVELSKALYEDWRDGVIIDKKIALATIGAFWFVPAYASIYALFVLFGGEA